MQPTRSTVRERFLRRADRMANVFADPSRVWAFQQRARLMFPATIQGEAPAFGASCLRQIRREIGAEVRIILGRLFGA